MAIMGDGSTSRGATGRWAVVLDAGSGRWAIFDMSPPDQLVVTHGPSRTDLADLRAAIAESLEGA